MHILRQRFKGRPTLVLTIAALSIGYAGVAIAAGWPPFAREDNITVKRGATVSVLDSGEFSVLANDIDIEGDELTAQLSRSPKRGDLTLNADGTFTYRHDGSGKNDDEFRYRAHDGDSRSREAKVKI